MMTRTWFWSFGLPLALGSLALCLVFASTLGAAQLGLTAALGLLAPPLVARWKGTVADGDVPNEATGSPPRGPGWFPAALFVAACGKFIVLGAISSRFVPALHDEWSYVFGAETLALGRISNGPPPHPEFFSTIHLLLEPRWVTRYPPGHPAALALGVLVGWPPLPVVLLAAGTVLWTYGLGSALGGAVVGRLAGLLALLAPGMNQVGSSYLAQTTFLFAMTGAYSSAIRALERDRVAWSVAAGLFGGWAFVTRPYSAAALGLPLAIWFFARVVMLSRGASRQAGALNADAAGRSLADGSSSGDAMPARDTAGARGAAGRHLMGAVLPLVAALALFAAYNRATMGGIGKTAWGEYNRRFEPQNTLGFAAAETAVPGAEPIEGSRWPNPLQEEKARTIAAEKRAFTPREALRRGFADPARLARILFPAVGFYGLVAFVPFAWRADPAASPRGPVWLIAAALVAHHAAYSLFYSRWGAYALELIPFVICLVAGGLWAFWTGARASDRPSLRLVVPLAFAAAAAAAVFETPRFVAARRADTAYERRFERTLRGVGDRPAIVFIRLDLAVAHPYDLVHNRPDLSNPILRVRDLGEHNVELIRSFPERRPYLFDEATWSLTRWTPPPPEGPARRLADPPRARVATGRLESIAR